MQPNSQITIKLQKKSSKHKYIMRQKIAVYFQALYGASNFQSRYILNQNLNKIYLIIQKSIKLFIYSIRDKNTNNCHEPEQG